MKDPEGYQGHSYVMKDMIIYTSVIIFVLLAAVVFTNLILSRWLARSILKTLEMLKKGSSFIKNGELDFDMRVKRRDEIGEVLNDFDEMRLRLKESVDECLKYEQYRKELIIGLSHDLRTPLTSIKGYVEGLHDGIANTVIMKTKYYEAIETGIDTLETLVSSLSDFSKTEQGFNRLEEKKKCRGNSKNLKIGLDMQVRP